MRRNSPTSRRPHLRFARPLLAAVVLLSAGTRLFAIAGKGAKIEFALDAPWRIEPTRDLAGKVTYGSIPIQISIHDALLSCLDEQVSLANQWTTDRHVGRFVDFSITQITTKPGFRASVYPPLRFGLLDLDLIERTTGLWQIDPEHPCLDPAQTEVCRVGSDPACAGAAQWIEGTSEWHALFRFTPQGVPSPGSTVRLQITARVTREQAQLSPSPLQLVREISLYDLEQDPDFVEDSSGLLNLVNEVAVSLADEPLPRFGDDWLYGDLHYHSQGTDNEGESAYNYRGVLEAMGAMGVDFVFATEHASASKQIVDGDTSVSFDPVDEAFCGLRDMSAERFATLHGALHGDGGANRTVMYRTDGRLPQTYLSHGAVPQVFLGGEVDVIPEIGAADLIAPRPEDVVVVNNFTMAEGFSYAFGDGLRYELTNLCGGAKTQLPGGLCFQYRVLESFEETYLLGDLQGFNDWYHARQHLIYLPGRQGDPMAFVGSATEKYGGGSRLLFRSYDGRSGIVPEIEAKGGVFFLAHPMASAGKGSEGPDLAPYSDYQLRALLLSPAFLGLQFWNEDSRLYSEAMDGPPPMTNRNYVLGKTEVITEPDGKDNLSWDQGLFTLSTNDAGDWNPQWNESRGSTFEGKLYHGAYTWDRMLLWGLGAKVTFTRGCEPRKVLMAGGSDAHGDFNYRREGAFHGTDGITDTAIAKPRNLVHAGAPNGKPISVATAANRQAIPHSQEQIIEALRSGEFCVTDGPALRISIGDTPMGGVHYLEGARISILVEWKSTAEFGPLDEIHLYVGAGSSESCSWSDPGCPEVGLVYTPGNAGPRNSGDEQYPTPGPYSSGPPFTIYRTNERLRINAASEGHPLGLEGSANVAVGNGDVRLADLRLADRYFVRAVGRTSTAGCGERAGLLSEGCQPRFAFTNPIWVLPASLAAAPLELFQRGDANGDGTVDLSDPLTTLTHLFAGGVAIGCEKAADADDNDALEITDAVRTLGHLFLGTEPPSPPYPDCGVDPTIFKGSLTCRSSPECGAGGGPAPACLADLAVAGFSPFAPLEIGKRVGFKQPMSVTVANLGGKISGACRLKFSHGSGDFSVAPLEPGETRGIRVDVSFPDTDLGRVIQLSATIDADHEVEESREDNNRSTEVRVEFPDHCEFTGDPGDPDPGRVCEYDPPPPPANPDLVAISVKVAGKIAAPDGKSYSVPVEVTLKNAGSKPAGPFEISLFQPLVKNGWHGTPWSLPGLAAGETVTAKGTAAFDLAAYQGKTLSLVAMADPTSTAAPSGSVIEEDETNNVTPAITVTFP